MLRTASAGLILAALLSPTASAAQANASPGVEVVAQADKAETKPRPETKPFDPHAAHAPTTPAASMRPWYDTSVLPMPILADDLSSQH